MNPAIGLLEFDSVAAGIVAADAMVKRAPLGDLVAGSVQPATGDPLRDGRQQRRRPDGSASRVDGIGMDENVGTDMGRVLGPLSTRS